VSQFIVKLDVLTALYVRVVKTKGKTGGMGRRGRRRKPLLDDLTETRRYWKLKEAALDRSLRRTRFKRGYGHVLNLAT
jgi:hypothetical protein